MLKGRFRTAEDLRLLAELKSMPLFRRYTDKLRQLHSEAVKELTYADYSALQVKQGYARCLQELLEELEK